MKQQSKTTGTLNLEVQSENEAQSESKPHPRTSEARSRMEGGVECETTRFEEQELLNLIVKCEAQSGTKALPLGLSPGVA